jgi:hypothetical protein
MRLVGLTSPKYRDGVVYVNPDNIRFMIKMGQNANGPLTKIVFEKEHSIIVYGEIADVAEMF